MADEKEKKEAAKIVLEREYNVPLRVGFRNHPKYKKTKKAVKVLREFIAKHMKSDNVKIGKYINTEMWKHGIKNPPHHVKVIAKKDSEGAVFVDIVGAEEKQKKEDSKKDQKKGDKQGKKELKTGEDKIKEKIKELKAETKEIVSGKKSKEEPKELVQKEVKEENLPAKSAEKK